MAESENLPRLAYVTYRNTLGWRDEHENVVPNYEELSQNERNAWEIVIDVVCTKFEDIHYPPLHTQSAQQQKKPVAEITNTSAMPERKK